MNKYRVTLEVELYGRTPTEAYWRVCNLLPQMLDHHRRRRLPEAIGMCDLPTGGLDGAPHTNEALDGWRCLYTVALDTDD